MEATKISWEQVKPLVPETSLYYVHYDDSFDESLPQVEACIHAGDYETLDEIIMDWEIEIEAEKKEVNDAIAKAFPNLTEEEVDEIMDEFEDEIRDQIYDNDKSTPIEDLFRNTGKQVMFYDTGYEMEADSWKWDTKRVNQERRAILKYLGIKTKDEKLISEIEMMIMQASYGGYLVIYFYQNPGDYIMFDYDVNSVKFSGFVLAVIDTSGGSGDHCYFPAEISTNLPFERERMHICKNIKCSYTYSVCGMVSDWCDSTAITLLPKKSRKALLNSGLSAQQDKDKKYAETYRAGKCTPGDMDITRHRKAFYVNDYPCGNRCQDCGTFWVD